MVLVTHNIGEAVLLSQRVIVMRHGRLVGEVSITLPETRDESLRRSPAFGHLYGRVGDLLRGGNDG
jgi:ABC-type nitrate/sulfonate/bicarbonate transport system ATPase subunit